MVTPVLDFLLKLLGHKEKDPYTWIISPQTSPKQLTSGHPTKLGWKSLSPIFVSWETDWHTWFKSSSGLQAIELFDIRQEWTSHLTVVYPPGLVTMSLVPPLFLNSEKLVSTSFVSLLRFIAANLNPLPSAKGTAGSSPGPQHKDALQKSIRIQLQPTVATTAKLLNQSKEFRPVLLPLLFTGISQRSHPVLTINHSICLHFVFGNPMVESRKTLLHLLFGIGGSWRSRAKIWAQLWHVGCVLPRQLQSQGNSSSNPALAAL